jgi:hypothetical protein
VADATRLEVYGIELNATAARYAREDLGLATCAAAPFADLDFPDGLSMRHMSMVLNTP